ncbi:MAG: EAL domain-containing protein [Acidimicrobiales bacterium]|nr:EAL domain-containing protein [Acidimicrobiales bacterium]
MGALLLWLSVPAFGGAGVVQGAYLVGSVLAAVAMWIGLWWRRPATPAPWRWLAAGLTAWAVADVVYAAYGWFGHPDPSVSVADALYFSGYGAVAIGLVLVIRARKPGGDLDALLDAAAVGVAALVMAWDLLIQPAIDPSASTGATVLFALYPVSDVILLALLVRLLLDTRLRSTPVVLLVAALCTWLVGDAAYSVLAATGSYEFGGTVWLDEVFLAGMFLMAGAALHPDMAAMTDERAEPRAERPYRLALGVVCVAVPGIAAAAADLAEDPATAVAFIVAIVLLAALVLARSIRLLRQKDTAEQALRRSGHYHQALAANSADAVLVVDAHGTLTAEAPALSGLLGLSSVPGVGASVFDLVETDDRPTALALLDRALSRPRQVLTGELRVRHRDGGPRWVEARVVSLVDDRDVAGVVVNVHDITLRKLMEQELSHQAFHDVLTGLANRALFRDRVDHAVSRTVRTAEDVAVLYIDLDGFKTINDSLGHDTGDAVLVDIARRLEQAVRGGDTVARLGGDEFGVLVEPGADARRDAELVARRVLAALADPIQVQGTPLAVGASIGIAVGHAGGDVLLRNADVAMYQAKATGKRRWVLFDDDMRAAAVERLRLDADLHRALDRGEMALHYQPIVELESGELTGFEALLRWHHPELGLIAPDRFIPVAEENGTIVPIGAWVLATACRTAAAWRAARPDGRTLTISVNVSSRQLAGDGFVTVVEDALADTGLDPSTLVLELTESYLMLDPERAAARLRSLSALGVRLAVDDFGTGYSSLSYLREFPVDILKIDRSFVATISEDEEVPSLIRAVLDLCRTMGLDAVAEGIEEPHQLDQLLVERCPLGQGFLFDRPLTEEAARALVEGLGTAPVSPGAGR